MLNKMDIKMDEIKQEINFDNSKQVKTKEVKRHNVKEIYLNQKMYRIKYIKKLESELGSLDIEKEGDVKQAGCSTCT